MRVPTRAPKEKKAEVVDDLGGTPGGRLLVATPEGTRLHVTPAPVVTSLRFLLARAPRSNAPLPSRLAVTSALHGEGVTFMTRSLASVLAYDSTDSVVVVDLDWRGPPQGRRSKKSRKRSAPKSVEPSSTEDPQLTLIDAIEGRATLDEILIATSNPRLQMISAGALPVHRRSAVAGSVELEKTVDQIASRFDRVLFDVPPVMATSDAITLSQLANAFLLVVRHGVTTATQVEAALQELRGTPQLGVVLNRFENNVPKRLRHMIGA